MPKAVARGKTKAKGKAKAQGAVAAPRKQKKEPKPKKDDMDSNAKNADSANMKTESLNSKKKRGLERGVQSNHVRSPSLMLKSNRQTNYITM